jgi:hypothetical protein
MFEALRNSYLVSFLCEFNQSGMTWALSSSWTETPLVCEIASRVANV